MKLVQVMLLATSLAVMGCAASNDSGAGNTSDLTMPPTAGAFNGTSGVNTDPNATTPIGQPTAQQPNNSGQNGQPSGTPTPRNPGTPQGTSTGTDTGTNTGSNPDAGTDSGTDSGTDTGTDTNTGTGTGTGTGTIPNPNNGSDTGNLCTANAQCTGGTCLGLPGGYCTTANCAQAGCPSDATCFQFEGNATYCLKNCTNDTQCDASHQCEPENVCWPKPEQPDGGTNTNPGGGTNAGGSPVGGACSSSADCKDAGATCYPAMVQGQPSGFVNGYCIIFDCSANSCPSGSSCVKVSNDGTQACVSNCNATSDCRSSEGYACYQPGICFPGCGQGATCPTNYGCDADLQICVPACTATSCGPNKVCGPDGICVDPPCTPGSCGVGMICAANGKCIPDVSGGPGVGPGPSCNNLPSKDCAGSVQYCGQLMQFSPTNGTGYTNYPLNGETWDNQWRSYARRDLQMLIKWATAYVDCKSQGWGGGNNKPLGLGDMSEANGAIPGTATGQPGHPNGTHENGYDMDIAYYQNQGQDNYLKPVCDHTINGADQYHCVSEPYLLDLWRTTLFIGALLTSDRTRVIGVDGKIGPLIEQAMPTLCANGWLPQKACNNIQSVAYEVTNTGKGWFGFHHHHLHISLWGVAGSKPGMDAVPQCLTSQCDDLIMTTLQGHAGCIGDHDFDGLPVLDHQFKLMQP